MMKALKHRLQSVFDAFASVRSTLIAQLLVVTLLGTVTIVGMSYVAKYEVRTTSLDWLR